MQGNVQSGHGTLGSLYPSKTSKHYCLSDTVIATPIQVPLKQCHPPLLYIKLEFEIILMCPVYMSPTFISIGPRTKDIPTKLLISKVHGKIYPWSQVKNFAGLGLG